MSLGSEGSVNTVYILYSWGHMKYKNQSRIKTKEKFAYGF